jgi:hypothetical protein
MQKKRLRPVATAITLKIVQVMAAALITLALLEVSLHLGLNYLPLPLADALGTGYVDFGNGIYRFDPEVNMERMRPHYHRHMFFNGYFWHHQTDWMGFRNPNDREHDDIVLIGDSMIYGHGLEEPSTVRSQLEKLVGRPVANLAIQGGAMDNEYEILRHDAVRLSPRFVFIFFLNNDLTDLGRLSDDELQHFIDLPVDDHTTRYFQLQKRWVSRRIGFDWRDLYVVRAYLLLVHQFNPIFRRDRSRGSSTNQPAGSFIPKSYPASDVKSGWTREAPFAGDPRMQLAMRFHLRAILKADDFAHRHKFHFAYVFIPVPLPFDSTYEAIIADYCRVHRIDFFSLRRAYENAEHLGVGLYLPRDGHLTAAGAEVTAEALANHFPLRSP